MAGPQLLQAAAPGVFQSLRDKEFDPELRRALSDDAAAITAARAGLVRG